MKFYLKKLANGRVFLSQIEPSKDEELIKTIDADAWIAAREKAEKVPDIYHNPGYGYFTH